MAQVPYQEDTDRRGSAYGHPSLGQQLRALIFPLFEKPVALKVANTIWISIPGSNYNAGRGGYGVAGIIIHTTVGTMASTDGTFQNPVRQASAHYAVGYDGTEVHQYVAENNTAWHCGRYYPGAGQPLANVNTIGIEHVDNGAYNSPRPDGLYATSAQLVKEISARYGIPIDRAHIRKHTEVSELFTQCPDSLDIERIVAMANGTWVAPVTTITSEDDMLYVGPSHPKTATVTTFVAGSSYRERTATSPLVANFAIGASIPVTVYCYSSSPVNCTDLDGKGTQGPDWLWWKSGNSWVPDAILNTSAIVPQPPPGIPAGEPLDTLFATQDMVKALPAGKDGAPGIAGPKGDAGVPGLQGPAGVTPEHHHVVSTTGPMV